MKCARRPEAFTLIEVIVSMSISMALMGVVLGLLAGAQRDGKRATAHSELMRDADLVSHLLNSELRLAGLGVPVGNHIDAAYGTTPPTGFYASVIVAATNAVGVVADLPRPDANLNAFGALHTRPTGGGTAVAWHNENNGTCVPDVAGTSCRTGNDSVLFPAAGAVGCMALGGGAAFLDRTCPWGLRRTLPGDSIVIVAGNGRWSDATLTGNVQQLVAGPNTVTSAELGPGFDAVTWPNVGATDGPGGLPGQGFVASLDRVFFQQVGSEIVRRQCLGDPDPNQAGWPDAATNAVPAAPQLAAATGVAINECTDSEVVARNVVTLAFTYFDAGGNPITFPVNPKSDIRRVDYAIDFSRVVDNRPVTYRINGSVRLENLL